MAGRTILLLAMSLDLGGAETHVISLAKALQDSGLEVWVGSQGGVLDAELTQAGIRQLRLPLHRRNPGSLRRAQVLLGDFLDRQPIDLIHAHARIPAFVADRVRQRRRVPLVTTYHANYYPGLLFRWASRWGDAVIAVSEDIREHLIRHLGAPADRIRVIPNGLDTERFHPGKAAANFREDWDLPSAGPVVVHLSRLDTDEPDRGGTVAAARALIQGWPLVLAAHPNARLLIVGGGKRREDLEREARAVNRRTGTAGIRLVGPRTDPEIFLRAADAVVGVARVALEGMASGKPVILAGEGGYAGLLSAENWDAAQAANFTGRLAGRPVTAEALASDLAALLARPDLGQALGEMGRERALSTFGVARMADSVRVVYEEVWQKKP